MILLAVIAQAHGIQGAVKLKAFTQDPANVVAYGPLHDEQGREYSLKLIRVSPDGGLIVAIKGIEDRNQAEALRGTKLYIERSQLPDLSEEEFYHSDLIGLKVQDLQDQDIGRVCAVNNYGAGDFLEIVDSDHHHYTVTFTRQAVPIIQLPEKGREGMIKVDRQYLLESTTSERNNDGAEKTSKKSE
jgi:16S rRNA processing protein RimM